LGDGERGERQRKETDKTGQQQSTYAYQMVRTDSREQKLDAFLVPKSLKEQQLPSHGQSMDVIEGAGGDPLSGGQGEQLKEGEESMEVVEEGGGGSVPGVSGRKRAAAVSLEQPFKRKMRRKEVTLTSVKSLQQSVRAKMHKGRKVAPILLFLLMT
jgi:DNA mismatch repair protein MLH1